MTRLVWRASVTRKGITLIELLVVLVVLSVVLSITGLASRLNPPVSPREALWPQIAGVRRGAIENGRVVSLSILHARNDSTHLLLVTAFPDGSVIADSSLHIDHLAGTPEIVAHAR